eukprot:958945_1
MSSCTQWGSKDSYDNIQLGSGTKFSVLYVDIPIFGARFANKVVEGGVRPPNLVSAGFTTGGATTGGAKAAPISIQWDSALYTCDTIFPADTNTPYTCTLSPPWHCPSFVDFWLSIYSDWGDGSFLYVTAISFVDETGTTYSFDATNGNFCRDPTGGQPGTPCDGSTFNDLTFILVGGAFMGTQYSKLVPWFVPDCVFDHPDDAAAVIDVDVGAGLIKTETPVPDEFGWESGEYGGPIPPDCPDTFKPTSDPTNDPTRDPTVDPTIDPTNDPTTDPTTEPTFVPTTDPTTDPTNDPTTDPTTEPTTDPTYEPTVEPTAQPTLYPTFDPTTDPTRDPTSDPTYDPTVEPTVHPTDQPSSTPTKSPTMNPTSNPSLNPSVQPTSSPSSHPTTTNPTVAPTTVPTKSTPGPSIYPTSDPTNDPTVDPTIDPTIDPTADPTNDPTIDPTVQSIQQWIRQMTQQ